MKSTIKGALVAFSISAAAAFSLMSATGASAAILTFPGKSCFASGGGTICPMQGGSSTAQVSRLYIDFISSGQNKLISSEMYRLTWTGTLKSWSSNATYSAGSHETSTDVTPLNANASPWDYLFAAVVGDATAGMNIPSNIYGMALVTP